MKMQKSDIICTHAQVERMYIPFAVSTYTPQSVVDIGVTVLVVVKLEIPRNNKPIIRFVKFKEHGTDTVEDKIYFIIFLTDEPK